MHVYPSYEPFPVAGNVDGRCRQSARHFRGSGDHEILPFNKGSQGARGLDPVESGQLPKSMDMGLAGRVCGQREVRWAMWPDRAGSLRGSGEDRDRLPFLRKYWGQGLSDEAAIASRDYAFQKIGLDRVISLIDPGNITASVRVCGGEEWHEIGTYDSEVGKDRKRLCRSFRLGLQITLDFLTNDM